MVSKIISANLRFELQCRDGEGETPPYHWSVGPHRQGVRSTPMRGSVGTGNGVSPVALLEACGAGSRSREVSLSLNFGNDRGDGLPHTAGFGVRCILSSNERP